MKLELVLAQAINEFQNGNIQNAKKGFSKILSRIPQHVGSMNYLALIYNYEKKYVEAEKMYKKILLIDQNYAETYFNYSLVLKSLGKYTAALSALEKAIQIAGISEEFELLYASLQSLIGKNEEALVTYHNILQRNPNSVYGLYGKAKILLNDFLLEDAKDCFEQCVKLNPSFYEGWIGLGEVYFSQSKYDVGHSFFCKASTLNETQHIAFKGIAKSCTKLNRQNEALDYYNKALKLNNEDEDTYILFINDLIEFKNIEAAENIANKAIEIFPHSSELYSCLGYIHLCKYEYDLANKSILKSLKIKPDNISGLINMGAYYSMLDKPQDSLHYYSQAYSLLNKNDVKRIETIRFFMSFNLFKCQKMKIAYEYYDLGLSHNLMDHTFRHPKRQFFCPQWKGQTLHDQKLLIWGEQGIGDQIYFLSCLPDLIKICSLVIVEIDKRLIDVLQRSFPMVEVRNENYDSANNNISTLKDYDFHIPMGSLMCYLRPTLESYTASQPYAVVNSTFKSEFKNRLSNYQNNLIVGICWKSGLVDKFRSMHYFTVDELGPLFQLKNITFVNLQYSDFREDLSFVKNNFGSEILTWDDLDLKNDLDHVFALISNLDCVISAPTAVQSMAAATGVKVFTLSKQRNWIDFGCDYDPWFSNSIIVPFHDNQEANGFDILLNYINDLSRLKFNST